MDLSRFKTIYAWEWSHRLLGRLIGVLFARSVRLVSGRAAARGWPAPAQLAGIFALGGLQGLSAGGWSFRPCPARRGRAGAARDHLLLASRDLAAVVWIAVGLQPNCRDALGPDGFARGAASLLVLALAQIVLGGARRGPARRPGLQHLAAMDGRFIPPADHLFNLTPWTTNFLDNARWRSSSTG